MGSALKLRVAAAVAVGALAAMLAPAAPAYAATDFTAPSRASVPDDLAPAVALPDTGDNIAVNPPTDLFGDLPTRPFLIRSSASLTPANVTCSAVSADHAANGLRCTINAADLDDNGKSTLWYVCVVPDGAGYPKGETGDTVTVRFSVGNVLNDSLPLDIDDTPPDVTHRWAAGTYVGVQSNTVEWSADDEGSGLVANDPAYATSFRWIRSPRYQTTQGEASFGDEQGAQNVGLTLNSGFTTYCMAVYAADRLGSLSVSGIVRSGSTFTGNVCTVIPGEDNQLAPAGGFIRSTGVNYSAGTVSYAQRTGATLTVPGATAKTIVVKGRSCPDCGSFEVFLGSRRLGGASLVGPSGFKSTFFNAPAETTGNLVLRTTSARWTGIDQVWASGPCVSSTNCFGLD